MFVFCVDMCWTSDVMTWWPWRWCMTEARLARELDMARLDFIERTGIRRAVFRQGSTVRQCFTYIQHHRAEVNGPHIFSVYTITTRLSWYDKKSLYLEHRVRSPGGSEYATVVSKLSILGVDVTKLLENLYVGYTTLNGSPPSDLINHVRTCGDAVSARLK